MKNLVSKALVALLVFGTTAQVHAYSYIFSNHTNKEIGLGMRYHGLGEPRYFRWVPTNESRQFTPKQATKTPTERVIEDRKIGFVAKTFWYVENPAASMKNNPKDFAWTEFQITWLPTESYKIAAKLGKALVSTTVEAGKLIADAALAAASAAAAAETGGASLAVQALLTSASAADKTTIFEALGKLMTAAGSMSARSMVTDRHIDMIETAEGIKFISQL